MEKHVQLWMLVKQCHLCDQNIDRNAEWTDWDLIFVKKTTTVTILPYVAKAMKKGGISEECEGTKHNMLIENFTNFILLLIQVLKKCQEYLKQLTTNPSYRYDNPQLFRQIKNETVILESLYLHLLHVVWSKKYM
ncbi:hypothetical protein RFI_02933 [Reticulomyxa filosa]|uniref:Uncharacterized protein n=1 Tax=Reticulomyxa filosa TaxID=46433 RepID=X6P7I4_RETFI|nr:hypothetical protein RFI_02933 [Reticulomyxa filosa]|eukprot:ETO34161.1 hypothetical protein RFI_02933 [Reticulomyxa filosa]